jgi:ABC-type sugar transport system substrate-binding protein
VLKIYTDAAEAEIKSTCPGCSITSLDASLTQVGNDSVVPAAVSAVRKDPSINYVITSVGSFVPGLPAALQAAGVNNVKIGGGSPSIENEQDLLSGTESAWTAQSYLYNAWQVVDEAARHLEGMSISEGDGGSMQLLLTKGNVGTPQESYDGPTDYQQQFEALWHVS